jgi:hypothetical protein
MAAALTPVHPAPTSEDLAEAGFSKQEIEALADLGKRYPYLEFTDSGKQWNHLKFVKWRFTNGDLARRN